MADNPSPNNTNGLTKWRQDSMERMINDLVKRVEKLEQDIIAARVERVKDINEAESDILRKVDELKDDLNDIELEMAKLGTRLTLFQGAQAIFTTIAGVIASIVGRQP